MKLIFILESLFLSILLRLIFNVKNSIGIKTENSNFEIQQRMIYYIK